MNSDISTILFCAVAVLLQLFVTVRAKRWFVRLLPVLLLALGAGGLIIAAKIVEGWDALGFVLIAAFLLIAAGGCFAAWLIGELVRLVCRLRR